ncbi:NAD+ synthase [Magnetovirga frankeli]|uniref:NAD+ synthase n=1 Tax=Magnetovirga frankeli TaxID=947516 RepID=UPI001293BF6F|nr:NAD+ synthase [gamma proteobacterium SS-5]
MNLALAQINTLVGDIQGNADLVLVSAREARQRGARLVLFPELTLTGYPPEDLLFRPELDRQVEAQLERIAAELADSGVAVVIGYPRMLDGKRFNAAGLIDGGRLLAEYHKAQLPNFSVFDEKRYFEPGGEPCVAHIDGLRLGLSICEDIWTPQAAAQARAAGAEVLLNLNASPFHAGKAAEREQLLAERARENAMPIVYVNLVGGQDELVFDGGSLLVDASGRPLHRSARFVEALDLISLPIAESRVPEPRVPSPESRSDERADIYQALVLGVRDYVRKNGFQGALLGLSGGIDSALVLTIAVDALGANQVEAVMMPSRYTAQMSNDDAARQARALGVYCRAIPIEPAFVAFQQMLAGEFAGLATDTTEENIQARCRGLVLMALSNKSGRILLTTGNKSEMAVGYATLYGDMAGGFAPIKDVPKTLVYRLANWRNRDGEVIPQRVIDRPPSAELRPDQRDSDSLPDYALLDDILYRYIELDQCRERMVEDGFDPALVARVTRLVDSNEYKRRQAPPGVRISRRAFGRDRRYPISRKI